MSGVYIKPTLRSGGLGELFRTDPADELFHSSTYLLSGTPDNLDKIAPVLKEFTTSPVTLNSLSCILTRIHVLYIFESPLLIPIFFGALEKTYEFKS